MVDYQNGQLGQAVDYAIIHHPDVVGIPVVGWLPRRKGNALFAQVSCFFLLIRNTNLEQLAVGHGTIYQVGRRTADLKLPPPALCISGSRPFLASSLYFSVISPT